VENSQLKNILFELVRLGIGNASMFSFPKDIDWNSIETIAKQQEFLGVLVDGVQKLPQSNRPPQIIWLRWIGEVMQGYEQRYVLYKKAVADLGAWYHLHGYRMMLLKGLACGVNWPKPEHRPYGDIDIYLFGQYKEADALMVQEFKEQGFKVDNSHHHHTVFQWQGFTVENHYDFVNVHVHRSSRELEGIFKGLAHTEDAFLGHTDSTDNTDICLPPANLHALFLVRHMVSHFSGASMSLRQVLDWGFFVKAHHEEVDWKWLVGVLEKYHMKAFFDCVNAICVEDLGFHPSGFKGLRVQEVQGSEMKQRVLNDTLSPEFSEETPKHVWKRVPFKYRRWRATRWKRELCYEDGQLHCFLGGVWNHLLKPAGI
jgi:hypothetical protein